MIMDYNRKKIRKTIIKKYGGDGEKKGREKRLK